MRILLAEDRLITARALKTLLERSGYLVDMVHTGTDALDYMLCASYDVLVLDIMMPGMDGVEALRRARDAGVTTPALFLTAKSQVEDRVAGLDAGADDYLPKPFDTEELLARVRALSRRCGDYTPPALTVGRATLDRAACTVAAGEKVERLNSKEYQLLELFFRRPGQVFSTEQLMEQVWGPNTEAELNVVWTNIGNLRRKLKNLDSGVEICSIRGLGYRLEEALC